MTTLKIEELAKDVEELNRLSSLSTRLKVKDILLIETRKLETEIVKLRELEQASNKEEPRKVPSNHVSSNNPSKCYDVKLTNYAWDQSDKFVKIFVDLSGVHDLPSEKVLCEFTCCEMKLTVLELNNRNYTLTIKNLLHPIEKTTSHWKVKKDKVIVFMNKRKENTLWSSLTGTDNKAANKMNDMNPNVDPSDGLMNIIKQLYNEGDDHMKRSIAKAWTEGQDKTPKDL